MKETGIIRRIDELGRIVIPKEMRTVLRLKEGSTISFYLDNGNIILKKYNIFNKLDDLGQDFANALYNVLKNNVVLTDDEKVIACAGKYSKSILTADISKNYELLMKKKNGLFVFDSAELKITEEVINVESYILLPVIISGDVIGSILVFSIKEKLQTEDKKIVDIAKNFLENYLEY